MTFNPIQLSMEPEKIFLVLFVKDVSCMQGRNGNYFGPNRAKDRQHQRPTVEICKLCKINTMSK